MKQDSHGPVQTRAAYAVRFRLGADHWPPGVIALCRAGHYARLVFTNNSALDDHLNQMSASQSLWRWPINMLLGREGCCPLVMRVYCWRGRFCLVATSIDIADFSRTIPGW